MNVLTSHKGRTGGFPRSHKSKYREDLGDSFDSSWEANLARYLNYLLQEGLIAGWARKGSLLLLPTGESVETKGNRHIEPDFQVFLWHDGIHEVPRFFREVTRASLASIKPYHGIIPILLEVKGRYKYGGGLLSLQTESTIREKLASDLDSMVKLIRLKKKYPDRLVYIFGDAEYERLRKEFKAQCPAWEGD